MKLVELQHVLRQIGVTDVKPFKKHQVQIQCPLAPWMHAKKTDEHPSLSILYDVPGKPTLFKCWTCKEQGRIWQLFDSFASLAVRTDIADLAVKLMDYDKVLLSTRFAVMEEGLDKWVYDVAKTDRIVLNEDVLDVFVPYRTSLPARRYLDERKVSDWDALRFELKYDPRQKRIIFPVRDYDGCLVGAVGRAIDDNPCRYYNYWFAAGNFLGGLNHIRAKSKRLNVVEGFFCLLRSYQWAWDNDGDTVCTWRGETSDKQSERLASLDKNIVFWYDMDEAGNLGWKKAKEMLGGVTFGTRRVLWDLKDEKGKFLDVGAMTESQYKLLYDKGIM